MSLNSPKDVMPWVGLYVAIASLICTLAMAADAFLGFWQRKLWFPCNYFTINAASITLIAIAMKVPVDLSSDDRRIKLVGIFFLFTMIANCLPSLGLLDDKELFVNIIALGILLITILVNVCIYWATKSYLVIFLQGLPFFMSVILWPFSVALTIPTSRKVLEHQYKELHRSTFIHQEIKLSSKELRRHVKRYWMMAETGNPQFVIACSPFCSAYGVICSVMAFYSSYSLVYLILDGRIYRYDKSDYKWSTQLIIGIQLIGILLGSVAPFFRSITTIRYFTISTEWSKNYLNMFRVENHWTERLQHWKRSHIRSNIPGRQFKKVFNIVKNMILNFCLALQVTVVVMCKTTCIIPRSCLILFYCCSYLCKSLLKWFKMQSDASKNNNVGSDLEEYTSYVLQIEEEAKLSKRVLRNILKSINQLLQASEKKQPINLLKFLEKSTGFIGVAEFDNDQVPPLHPEEIHNSWSLVAVTLSAIALALPNINNCHVKALLASMSEGLQFVEPIEDSVNASADLLKGRKTARRLWSELEFYRSWLQINLRKKAHEGKMSKDILQWLGDEAIKIVIQLKGRKDGSLDHSLHKFVAASSMYRISQTILFHCNEQENWPTDKDLFEKISTIIADVLCTCFTNLSCAIRMKCHHKAIEKRSESIQSAAELLGKSKKILKKLKARQLPNIDLDSMAYIDKWHELLKSQIPDCHASSARIQPASSTRIRPTSSSFDGSHVVTIM